MKSYGDGIVIKIHTLILILIAIQNKTLKRSNPIFRNTWNQMENIRYFRYLKLIK